MMERDGSFDGALDFRGVCAASRGGGSRASASECSGRNQDVRAKRRARGVGREKSGSESAVDKALIHRAEPLGRAGVNPDFPQSTVDVQGVEVVLDKKANGAHWVVASKFGAVHHVAMVSMKKKKCNTHAIAFPLVARRNLLL